MLLPSLYIHSVFVVASRLEGSFRGEAPCAVDGVRTSDESMNAQEVVPCQVEPALVGVGCSSLFPWQDEAVCLFLNL